MNTKSYYVSRVNQLDATALDDELISSLKTNLLNGLEFIQHNWLLSREPEIVLAARLLLWHYTVHTDGTTIGQKLFELKYRDSKGEKIGRLKLYLLAVFWGIVPWARSRLPKFLSDEGAQILDLLDVILRFAGVLNFLAFLYHGRYSNLVERILSVRHFHSQPQAVREVQYEYMNRELLWNGIAEFIAFVIPLINLRRIRNSFVYTIWPKMLVPSLAEHRTREDFLACALCGQPPITPHDMGCRHVFCYYCLMSSVMTDPRFRCPMCHHQAEGNDSVRLAILTYN